MIGKIKQNELDCRGTAPLTVVAIELLAWLLNLVSLNRLSFLNYAYKTHTQKIKRQKGPCSFLAWIHIEFLVNE